MLSGTLWCLSYKPEHSGNGGRRIQIPGQARIYSEILSQTNKKGNRKYILDTVLASEQQKHGAEKATHTMAAKKEGGEPSKSRFKIDPSNTCVQ